MRSIIQLSLAWQPVAAVLVASGAFWALILPPLLTGDPASSIRGAAYLMIDTGRIILGLLGAG